MIYKVRKAVKSDSLDLANIIVESWKSAYSDIIPKDEITKYLDKERRQRQFERFIEDEEIVLIGYLNDIACGLVFANKENDQGLEECGSIYSIYMLQEYWGKGLSAKLMDSVLDILKEKGCKRASLWVYKDNIRARRFYEKCGFIYDGNKKYSHFSNKPIELRYIKQI